MASRQRTPPRRPGPRRRTLRQGQTRRTTRKIRRRSTSRVTRQSTSLDYCSPLRPHCARQLCDAAALRQDAPRSRLRRPTRRSSLEYRPVLREVGSQQQLDRIGWEVWPRPVGVVSTVQPPVFRAPGGVESGADVQTSELAAVTSNTRKCACVLVGAMGYTGELLRVGPERKFIFGW